ncbi:MAG: ABC transporter permease subunit [Anaerolineae bacterium]|nr:ABC transporter permease subunit [Gloeobacterales cyanobacterium ES-bin-313]
MKLLTGKRVVGNVLVAPAIAYLIRFLALPLLAVFAMSFLSRGSYGNVLFKFNPLNYVRLFDPLYAQILGFSLAIAGATTVLTLVAGYPLAYVIARSAPKWRPVLLFGVLLPFWTNFMIRIYAWMMILRSDGLLHAFLSGLGLLRDPLDILYTPGAVLIGMVYEYLPFMILPLYTSLEKIEEAQLAAAADLGAKPAQVFWRIVWPLSLPGVTAGVTLVFVPAMGMFVVSDLMGGAKSLLVGNLIRNQFLSARDWPFGAAAAVVLLALTLILVFVYTRQTRGAALSR